MHLEILVDRILSETGFTNTDRLKTRQLLTYKEVFTALIRNNHLSQVAIELNLTQDIVEKIASRKLKPLFPEKDKNTKWCNFLLSLIDYKKCNTCSECKPYSEFTISKNTWDGKSYICCTCKTIYREGFTEYNSEYAKEHYIQHKAEYIARAIQYKTKRTLATPPWADLNEIRRIYKECPDGYHIDHVIPLQGDLVSGLHVETNLKPIPALDNLRKHNKFEIE